MVKKEKLNPFFILQDFAEKCGVFKDFFSVCILKHRMSSHFMPDLLWLAKLPQEHLSEEMYSLHVLMALQNERLNPLFLPAAEAFE